MDLTDKQVMARDRRATEQLLTTLSWLEMQLVWNQWDSGMNSDLPETSRVPYGYHAHHWGLPLSELHNEPQFLPTEPWQTPTLEFHPTPPRFQWWNSSARPLTGVKFLTTWWSGSWAANWTQWIPLILTPKNCRGFRGSSAGKECACNAGDPNLILGLGRSHREGIGYLFPYAWASLVAQIVKNLPAMRETWV